MVRALPRIPQRLLGPLFLAFLWSTAGLCAVAVHLGRSAPATAVPRSLRRWPSPPLLGVKFCTYSDARTSPFILDAETGAVVPFSLPDDSGLDLLGFSPWRDAAGESHMIALQRINICERDDSTDESYELARYTFPSGRLLDRVVLPVPPIGSVCWFPDGSDRILFAGGDHRLYLHDFMDGVEAARSSPAPRPRALQWQCDLPGEGPVQLQDPFWPAAPGLGGRLLVSMTLYQDDSRPGGGPQLWWLQLDPDSATIVATGRLVVPEESGSIPVDEEERLPCVGTMRDGTLMLAYLTRTPECSNWDLWVAPITFAGPGRAPCVLQSSRRKLATGCAGIVLAFSADGRTIYVSLRDKGVSGNGGTLRSFPVAEGS